MAATVSSSRISVSLQISRIASASFSIASRTTSPGRSPTSLTPSTTGRLARTELGPSTWPVASTASGLPAPGRPRRATATRSATSMISVSGKRRPTCAEAISGTASNASRISCGRTANRFIPSRTLACSRISAAPSTPSVVTSIWRIWKKSFVVNIARHASHPPKYRPTASAGSPIKRTSAVKTRRRTARRRSAVRTVAFTRLSRGPFRRRSFFFPSAKVILFPEMGRPALCHTPPIVKTFFRRFPPNFPGWTVSCPPSP